MIYTYYIICTYANTQVFVRGHLGERLSLSLTHSQIRPHAHTHTQESDVTVSMSALLDADTLTDDGMHLVLQTGSTPDMQTFI